MSYASPERPGRKYELPKSCTNLSVNFIGLASLFSAVLLIKKIPMSQLHASLFALAALALPIILLECFFLKTYRRPSAGLDFSLKRQWNRRRIAVKLLGFYVILALIAFAYWALPEYDQELYSYYWEMLRLLLPWLLVGAIPYVAWVDRFMTEPEDGYWHMGMAVLGRWARVDRKYFSQHILGWLVKAFFLPLMFTYFVRNIEHLQNAQPAYVFSSFKPFFEFCWEALFMIDLAFVSMGYLLTLRIFDSHIRSTEPTLLGWSVAILCYQPFFSFFYSTYLTYESGFSWDVWLSSHPLLYACWGSAILFFLGIYVFATVPFGLRFSNLTHRGILTNGPYRFTKHPAYVSKNIVWWLVAIPFIPAHGVTEAVRYCTLLLCLNGIYVLRARTEERHLSRDPVYVAYALAMNERSVFRGLGGMLPFLQYREPSAFWSPSADVTRRSER